MFFILYFKPHAISTTMKYNTNLLLFFTLALFLSMGSCGVEAELIIKDSEMDRLTAFVDEANRIARHYEDLQGPKGAEIFGNNKAAVCGNEHDFIGPCIWAIDDIVEALGYRDIGQINDWMLDAGGLLYEMRKVNQDFDSQSEFINEVACVVAPEIMTRSNDQSCTKTNLKALLKGALNGGSSHTTKYYHDRDLSEEEKYVIGSSFYKIWRYMVNTAKCK